MKVSVTTLNILSVFGGSAHAFIPLNNNGLQIVPTSTSSLKADTAVSDASTESSKSSAKSLGLLTFDLDDTLYPIAQIVEDANAAFVTAMERFGFEGVDAFDIVNTGKEVREELHAIDPEKAAGLTHTEKREMAIRREMERIILARKLQECADDWATPVESLSPIVRKPAQQWAKGAVSESVVQQVLTAWEMERHHSAERHIFPGVIDALKAIKKEHPDVIIGAVTDGKANPQLMTFTLAPYFDFCMSWEDEQGSRQKFFRDLNDVESTPELTWIYDAARHKYAILKEAQCAINAAKTPSNGEESDIVPKVWPESYDDLAWIHVGDDLAFDVGGSALCGAKTILIELPKSLGQTSPFRFDTSIEQPSWSTTSKSELEGRIRMNEAARELVKVEINTLERLPIAVNQILRDEV
jgi:putative hydrolase of the HAD superfamily